MQFRVDAKGPVCGFSYSTDGKTWETLVAETDAKLLTTDVAGGFVGATVGVHARLDSAAK
ncbi:MAG: hypothetical protein NVV63_18360 [Opitutus sp.]|nr:hypothetical protein [Opitutus sp.]